MNLRKDHYRFGRHDDDQIAPQAGKLNLPHQGEAALASRPNVALSFGRSEPALPVGGACLGGLSDPPALGVVGSVSREARSGERRLKERLGPD